MPADNFTPLKKSELYSSLWASCDELRGGMDASQYKDYVLVLLFVKYVSDKAASQKGYLLDVPKGGRFGDMLALKGDKEVGHKINNIIARLAEANDLRGVIDVADFNDADKLGKGKEMVDRLSNLVGIFEGLDFGANRAEGDDLLGDAYEYLMRHFATESGKSKGQFYTPAEVKPAIFGHPEFTAFNDSVTRLFAKWKKAAVPHLKGFAQDGHPKALIETIAEDLLATFRAAPLLNAYDVYQHLMDYWAATMQDDCYLIAADGWRDAAQPRLIIEDKHKKTRARPDFTLGKKKYQAELIPAALIIRRWFADEQAALEKLEADCAALQQQMEEMAEEDGGEEGLLADAANDKGKLTKASVTARLKEIKGAADAADELKALKDYLALVEQEAATADKLAGAQDALTEKVAARYPKLTEDEIKTLVVEDKWLGTLAAAVQGELDRVSQTLTGRIRQLAERYATPLPALTDEVEALAGKVAGHLAKMGFKP